jgi:hypothetical protein
MTLQTMKTRKTHFEVLDAAGTRIHCGEYWPGVGVSLAMEDGPERNEVEAGVRFLHDETMAVSANLNCGLSVARLPAR